MDTLATITATVLARHDGTAPQLDLWQAGLNSDAKLHFDRECSSLNGARHVRSVQAIPYQIDRSLCRRCAKPARFTQERRSSVADAFACHAIRELRGVHAHQSYAPTRSRYARFDQYVNLADTWGAPGELCAALRRLSTQGDRVETPMVIGALLAAAHRARHGVAVDGIVDTDDRRVLDLTDGRRFAGLLTSIATHVAYGGFSLHEAANLALEAAIPNDVRVELLPTTLRLDRGDFDSTGAWMTAEWYAAVEIAVEAGAARIEADVRAQAERPTLVPTTLPRISSGPVHEAALASGWDLVAAPSRDAQIAAVPEPLLFYAGHGRDQVTSAPRIALAAPAAAALQRQPRAIVDIAATLCLDDPGLSRSDAVGTASLIAG